MPTIDARKAFLGVGWSFPPCVAANGDNTTVMYEDDVQQSLRIILGTDQGERLMRPDFGAGLRSFVFGPISQTIMQKIKSRVQDALITWEPRIDVQQVNVKVDASERSKLLIDINYRVRATNTLHNLVYPFYLQEGSSR
jgi:phage baseplate assembly protein W